MKKVDLNVMEQRKYEVIKKLVETDGNKKRAAMTLNCSTRHINRLIKTYKEQGKSGFQHGNRGRKPSIFKGDNFKQDIIDLYKTKYYDTNFSHFKDLLAVNESITVSYSFIHTTLSQVSILSPKPYKRTVSKLKKILKEKQKQKRRLTCEEQDLIVNNNILDSYSSHARLPRVKYFGERVEIDASEEFWINGVKWHLHGAIDCSTGVVLGGFFDYQETLNGYYHLFEIIWRKYGVPYKFVADNRTVFAYNSSKEKTIEKDTLTQFGYACHQLGVNLETTSIPEKKGRIERLWQSFQGRLIPEMRLANIQNIEEANEFLKKFIAQYNKKFALPIDYTTSVFEDVDKKLINSTLSIVSTRIFDKGCSIKFKNKHYQAFLHNKMRNFRKGTKCLVIETFDKKLLCNVDDTLYELVEVDKFVSISIDFDIDNKKAKQHGKYIPPITHPWKQASFMAYLNKQKRYENSANVYY